MKKYLRYSCNLCKRTTDRLVDPSHFVPDQCTITFKCEGRLQPIEYRSNAGITSTPEVGVVDWRARGSTEEKLAPLNQVELINTATGVLGQLVIAGAITAIEDSMSLFSFAPPNLVLTLAVRNDTPKAYRQYVFRSEGSIESINGTESGLEKKVLRFTPSDSVEVFLNGVKLEQGSAPENYTIYDGTSSSVVPNTIKFNQTIALPGIMQVDVVVSAQATTSTISLELERQIADESRLTKGAWENIDTVTQFGTQENILNVYSIDLEEATQLSLNTIMTVVSAKLGTASLNLDKTFILLARNPYSQVDRYTSIAVPLSTLSFERDYLKYFVVDGKPMLCVTSTAPSPIYPPLRTTKFSLEKTIQQPLPGVINQFTVDGRVIVGPDV